MLQVRHGGGKNTNKVVSYSFFKAVGMQSSKCVLPALCVCVPACLQGGQCIHLRPEGEMARILPGRTLSLESSLSCKGIVSDSILFGLQKGGRE